MNPIKNDTMTEIITNLIKRMSYFKNAIATKYIQLYRTRKTEIKSLYKRH